MIGFRKSMFSCLVLACSLTSASGTDGDAGGREQAKAIQERIQRQPMIFFVATGGPNACGPGCSEWIAAEGAIDPNAAQRFRDFLGTLAQRDLPIFFNSTGGIAGQAMVLGALLREHRMAVGVGRTIPEGCRQSAAIDEACRRVMQAKREHRARLMTEGARCISACVYAFVGGSVRRVAPSARLGIHAFRLLWLPSQGWIAGINDVHLLLKRYMLEMGVDPGLADAAAKVGADGVRYMSRDEITQFGIETRGFYETPWMPYQIFSNQLVVLKSITEATELRGKQYRTSNLRIWCIGGGVGVWLVYQREVLSNEIGTATVIRLAAGDGEYVLKDGRTMTRSGQRSVTAAQDILRQSVVGIRAPSSGREERSTSASLEFLRNAVARPSIVITESFASPGNGSSWSRVVNFSTNGLSTALEALQKDCGEPKFLDALAIKFLDVPGVQGGQ